jgi:hypothetical protein
VELDVDVKYGVNIPLALEHCRPPMNALATCRAPAALVWVWSLGKYDSVVAFPNAEYMLMHAFQWETNGTLLLAATFLA